MHVPIIEITKIGLALAFLGYGYACIATSKMVSEFARYGIPKLRLFVGCLEIAGGLGILVGYLFPGVGLLATAGLGLLMLAGVVLRTIIQDSVIKIIPAAFFMVLAFVIFYTSMVDGTF